ncbi:MAG: glutamate racemase [Cyclobacteriaceae bacterium]|jgi:glutamate racemase
MAMAPIGVFDSGYGGLTVLKSLKDKLPLHDFLYLGDNARTPYGSRSFQTIYEYTLEAVKFLFNQGCHLVVLACNTASAKALRTIQQNDLPKIAPNKRVLGVIRPTAEIIGQITKSGQVGILGTLGTVKSDSYVIEIKKQDASIKVYQQACPLWVPLVEAGEIDGKGCNYYVKKYLDELLTKSDEIDTILLACTHYPLLNGLIRKHTPERINILSQGPIIATSLEEYLIRHPEIEKKCSKSSQINFLTTDDPSIFDHQAVQFFDKNISSQQVHF